MLDKIIPTEILCNIFSYLNRDDTMKCKFTCRKFYDVSRDNSVICNNIINTYGKLFGPVYAINYEIGSFLYLLRNFKGLDLCLTLEVCIYENKWDIVSLIIKNYIDSEFITNQHIQKICEKEKLDVFTEICHNFLLPNINFDIHLLYLGVEIRAKFIYALYITNTYNYISLDYLYFCVVYNHVDAVEILLRIPAYVDLIQNDLAPRINNIEMLHLLWNYIDITPTFALLEYRDSWNEEMLLYLLNFENVKCNRWLINSACASNKVLLLHRILNLFPAEFGRYIFLLGIINNNELIMELIYKTKLFNLDTEIAMAVFNNDPHYLPIQEKSIIVDNLQKATILINNLLMFINKHHPEQILLFVNFYREKKSIIKKNSDLLKLISVDIYPYLNKAEQDELITSFDDYMFSTAIFYGTEEMICHSLNLIDVSQLRYFISSLVLQQLIKVNNIYILKRIVPYITVDTTLLEEIIETENYEIIELFLTYNKPNYTCVRIASYRKKEDIFNLVVEKYGIKE